jgi:hypothetical protein
MFCNGAAQNGFRAVLTLRDTDFGGKGDEDTEGEEGGGVGGRLSKDNGAGDGDCLSLSFRVI